MADWRDEIHRRLAGLRLPPAREADIVRELEQHLEDRFAEMRSAGHGEEDARRAALAEVDDVARLRVELAAVERIPSAAPVPGDPRRGSPLGDRWQDIRYAGWMLRRAPGFAVTAILTLAIGIGATVAIASAAYTVLYRPLPLADADRLVVPVSTNPGRGILRDASVAYADYVEWRGQRDMFDEVALYRPVAVDISGAAEPERLDGLEVSAEFFAVFRMQPIQGRAFARDDHGAGAPRVAVISEGLWKRRFSAAAVVGSDIRLGGTPTRIVGIVRGDATWPDEQDLWLPMQPAAFDEDTRTRRDNMIFEAVARLRENVTLAQARSRVGAIAARVAQEHPKSRQDWRNDVVSLREFVVEPETRLGMLVLLGGAVFVLLIACVNLANLLLARGADRAREMAVRAALGASRRRLVRQLGTETLVLASVGGLAGVMLAWWLLAIVKAAAPPDLPMLASVSMDGVAMLAAAGVSCLAALLSGVVPALTLSALEPADGLREGARTSGGRQTRRLRELLAVTQMALAVVLLIGAGLMIRSVAHLLRVDPGVDVGRILAGRVVTPTARYPVPLRAPFYDRLVDAMTAQPGVEAAAAASYLPAGGGGFGLGRVFLLEGQPEPPASADYPAAWNVVTPEYFRTLGIAVVRGRAFTRRDSADAPPVMIINETMARRVFGDGDPVGRRVRSWRDENLLREIVGVVKDVRYFSLGDETRSLVYVPYTQDPWRLMTVAVRSSGDPSALAGTLRREVARLDPDLAVARIRTLSSLAADSIAPQRFGALLIVLFAAAAALLAGTGVYGVMSYAVAQRRHEFSVRLALGATPAELFRLVMRRGLGLAAAGSALGLAGGIAAAPVLGTLLFGVDPHDPATLLIVPLVLLGVALAASGLPGHRAARADPLQAIRD